MTAPQVIQGFWLVQVDVYTVFLQRVSIFLNSGLETAETSFETPP